MEIINNLGVWTYWMVVHKGILKLSILSREQNEENNIKSKHAHRFCRENTSIVKSKFY